MNAHVAAGKATYEANMQSALQEAVEYEIQRMHRSICPACKSPQAVVVQEIESPRQYISRLRQPAEYSIQSIYVRCEMCRWADRIDMDWPEDNTVDLLAELTSMARQLWK